MLPRYEADKLYQWEKLALNTSSALADRRQTEKGLKWMAARPVRWREAGSPLDTPWEMLVQEGRYRSPDDLPVALAQRPGVVSGRPFTAIRPVVEAAVEERRRGRARSDRDTPPTP